ncbi:MAG TPA: hypothetical protein VF950_01290 [Planctomycetota bacterium]
MSVLLIEELFAAGDARFIEEILKVAAPKTLAGFAAKWIADPRPWALDHLAAYAARALGAQNQRFLLKKLFKTAEDAANDRAMAVLMTALDGAVRRSDDGGGRLRTERAFPGTFSVHTRHYLRRRAWRYFRRLGFQDPKRYLAAILEAIPRYEDAAIRDGVRFLDQWGLIHALFHHSDVLWARRHGWFVRGGRALKELKPAPAYPDAWPPEAVFRVFLGARARPVRRWALALLKSRNLLEKVDFARVVEMLEHAEPEVHALGVELLGRAAGLESVPMEAWLRLLESKNLDVLSAVCDIMAKVVDPSKVPTDRLLLWAVAPLGPVARLAVGWLKGRTLSTDDALRLAGVRAGVAAAEAVRLAREALAPRPDFDPEWILAFLDARLRETRDAAWAWFSDEKKARHRLDLWSKIVETPYDDVRLAIVGHLEAFATIDTALRVLLVRAPLETIWATVLLNIHRGGRAKRLAAGQLADAIERDPAQAPRLLPLLAVAARSVRAPEFRAGLAAIVRAAVRRPEVAADVAKHFPELRLVL